MRKTDRYEGTPQEIGSELFINHVMPFIRLGSKGMNQRQLAELYAGFMAGYAGSLAADFGKDAAVAMIQIFAAQVDDLVGELDQGMMQ